MKNVLVVYNPISGKNSSRMSLGEISSAFKRHGFDVKQGVTTHAGHATEIVQENSTGKDLIACCGGDGTFKEVVRGMVETSNKTPLMYVPIGSTNDLANTIGVSKNIDEQISLFKSGSIHSYDVGSFNDNNFNYVASFGVGADSSYKTSQKLKNILGYTAYMLDGFVLRLPHHIKNLRSYRLKIEHDRGFIEDDFYFGAVSNSNVVAGLFRYDNKPVRLNDGKFECLFVRRIKSVPDAIKLLRKCIRQKYDGEQIVMFDTSTLKISSDKNTAWTLDGEFGGEHKEMEISVNCSAVNIVSPNSRYFSSSYENINA